MRTYPDFLGYWGNLLPCWIYDVLATCTGDLLRSLEGERSLLRRKFNGGDDKSASNHNMQYADGRKAGS